jgi:hypothetical protein
MVHQRVANAADAPLSGAPQGGGVNHVYPGENAYLMQLQTDKVKFTTKPSRIQEDVKPDQRVRNIVWPATNFLWTKIL